MNYFFRNLSLILLHCSISKDFFMHRFRDHSFVILSNIRFRVALFVFLILIYLSRMISLDSYRLLLSIILMKIVYDDKNHWRIRKMTLIVRLWTLIIFVNCRIFWVYMRDFLFAELLEKNLRIAEKASFLKLLWRKCCSFYADVSMLSFLRSFE